MKEHAKRPWPSRCSSIVRPAQTVGIAQTIFRSAYVEHRVRFTQPMPGSLVACRRHRLMSTRDFPSPSRMLLHSTLGPQCGTGWIGRMLGAWCPHEGSYRRVPLLGI